MADTVETTPDIVDTAVFMKPETDAVIEDIAPLIAFDRVETAVFMKPETANVTVLIVAETVDLTPSTKD